MQVLTNIEGSFMPTYRFGAILCSVMIGTMPLVAIAQANHNTARSNKSTVATPAGEVVAEDGSGEQPSAGRKGYQYYQAQSDLSAGVTKPASGDEGQAVLQEAPASGRVADADTPAEVDINTSPSKPKSSVTPNK